MYEVLVLLVGCSILAYISDVGRTKYIYANGNVVLRENGMSRFFLCALCTVLILFSGLRTMMNDTAVYLINFSTKIPNGMYAIADIKKDIGANPLFIIYQIIIRTYISDNGNVFFMITAMIVIISYVSFLRKYSYSFSYSVYLLLAFTVYAFTMAAMKQTFAIAIAIWSVPLWINRKRLLAIVLIVISMFIHPYIVVYFTAFLLTKNVWDSKTALMIIFTLIASASFTNLIDNLINAASAIGDIYDTAMLIEGQMSIARVLVYLVIPTLSFFYRRQIRENGNRYVYTFINLSIVSTCFAMLARSGGANLFGRMANYFDIFQCLALPMIVDCGPKDTKKKQLFKIISICCYAFFYYTYYSKYLIYGSCFYSHISLLDFMKGL